MWGKVVFNVEKSYDRLYARKPHDFNVFITSYEFVIDQKKIFTGPVIDYFTVFNNMISFLIVVNQEVSNLERSVVVHKLELAINRDLYGCLCSLGSQKNLRSLAWFINTYTKPGSILKKQNKW